MSKTEKPTNQIVLKNVRLSYPNLFKAKGVPQADGTISEPKFSAVFILDKRKHAKEIETVQAAIDNAALGMFKKKVHLKHPGIRDGIEKMDKDGYGEDVMFLSASSKNRPQTVHRDPSIPLVEQDGVIYAGCYVNACVNPWAFDHKMGGKGVSFNLLAVQFADDGPPFGERVEVEEVFSNISDDADPLG